MKERFFRVYKKLDIHEIKEHLLIYGDLSANCANCRAVDVKLNAENCPECHTPIKYIAFRNIRNHLPKLHKILEERPHIIFIDHDDFKRNLTAFKAEEFLK